MSRFIFAFLTSAVVSVFAINSQVYKVVLTQKGYAQFLQYDVETPPLREFTFCTWIRVYELGSDQTIFTYVAKGNNRVVRLWLDSGGRMKFDIEGRVMSTTRVDVAKDVWRHVCLSYQSDFGAWALYIDSRLASCETAHSLRGFVLPGGGSVIIGYGTANDGAPNGFEGEIFGANMILLSTIERNYTMKQDPLYVQRKFKRNKLKDDTKNMKYIVFSDLLTDEIHNNFEKSPPKTTPRSFIKIKTPETFIQHDVGRTRNKDQSTDHEIFDFNFKDYGFTANSKIKLSKERNYKISNEYHNKEAEKERNIELYDDKTPKISEYETPPPPPSPYFDASLNNKSLSETLLTFKDRETTKDLYISKQTSGLSEIETPPPQTQNTKVYGQWTSSKFAGKVLNYLKSINFKNPELRKKIPPTIPLHKISEAYPYATEFKISKLRPPSQFQRRNIIENRYSIVNTKPQINVQIFEDDIRSFILKTHANTKPKEVKITNRGAIKPRFYRNANYEVDDSIDSTENIYEPRPRPFTESKVEESNHRYYESALPLEVIPKASIRPYVTPLKYVAQYIKTTTDSPANVNEDLYSKFLSDGNKWHNVKTYSNDYTPHKINIADGLKIEDDIQKQYPAIRLNYIHEKHTTTSIPEDPSILKGRRLVMQVSRVSSLNKDSVSILQNNEKRPKTENIIAIKSNMKLNNNPANFNRNVKIGNALNERDVVGDNDKEKKESFVGGNDEIPDLSKYRSDIDEKHEIVPPSLGPRVCKNLELCDRVLYVQQDESVDMTHIVSPVRVKNVAIEFVMQNYKKCSLTDSPFQKNAMLFIDWSETPVRLFGGAYPQTTTDLCGFF